MDKRGHRVDNKFQLSLPTVGHGVHAARHQQQHPPRNIRMAAVVVLSFLYYIVPVAHVSDTTETKCLTMNLIGKM